MISFDAAHRAVHYPPDRRFRLWIRPSIPIGIGIAILSVIAASWIEVAVAGLPHVPAVPQIYPNNFTGPHGFPVWVRYCHFFNFLFVMMLIRSGLSILSGSSSSVFQRRLHAGERMDPAYAPKGSTRPRLDRERRRPLYFATDWHAGLPAHNWYCTGLAFHRRARLHRHRHFVRRHALRYRAVAAYCADFAARPFAGMEHVGALRDVSSASRAQWFLWLQRVAADCLFHRRICLRPFGDPYRDRHVARRGESLSLVRADLWRQAIGQIDPFPDHAQLPCIPRRTCHVDRDDGIRAEYEPYCARYG